MYSFNKFIHLWKCLKVPLHNLGGAVAERDIQLCNSYRIPSHLSVFLKHTIVFVYKYQYQVVVKRQKNKPTTQIGYSDELANRLLLLYRRLRRLNRFETTCNCWIVFMDSLIESSHH